MRRKGTLCDLRTNQRHDNRRGHGYKASFSYTVRNKGSKSGGVTTETDHNSASSYVVSHHVVGGLPT